MCDNILYQHGRVVRGQLLRRYKRFLADVLVSNGSHSTERCTPVYTASTTVHCPNTGAMTGLLDRANAPVVLSVHEGTKRKYAHTLEMIQPEDGGSWVGVHSALANKLVQHLLQHKQITALLPYNTVRTEVTIAPHMKLKRTLKAAQSGHRPKTAKSRMDFQLEGDSGLTFLEVKSVTMAQQSSCGKRMALFPDTVSDRAQKHMKELISLVESGHKAVCLFMVQRSDCDEFAPSHSKDPEYARLVQDADAAGVQIIAVACDPCPDGSFKYTGELTINLAWSE